MKVSFCCMLSVFIHQTTLAVLNGLVRSQKFPLRIFKFVSKVLFFPAMEPRVHADESIQTPRNRRKFSVNYP